jgi:predicted dehydrogenase
MPPLKETPARRTRYAICGLSNRGIGNFLRPILGSTGGPDGSLGYGANSDDFSSVASVVAVLDPDEDRVAQFNATQLPEGHGALPWFGPDRFDDMIAQTSPDVVLVASPDHSHVDYILAALAHGVDVITEKPLTSTAADAARVLAAERDSAGRVRVAHNLRYSARHRQIKQLIDSGAIGTVTHATLDYHVDTSHGASYFLRWNRLRDRSGGLSVHKSCHHLDLMNWLIADVPRTVFAFGALNYYGPRSPHRPVVPDGATLSAQQLRHRDPYYVAQRGSGAFPDSAESDRSGMFGLTYPQQYPGGQDLYLYDSVIDIEDTYSSVIGYERGASVAYSIDFSSPWEGYSLGISGTHGRIEAVYGHERDGRVRAGADTITYYPLFGQRQLHDVRTGSGGHDGADALLRQDLFGIGSAESRKLSLAADTLQGAYAVAAGEAMWRSAATSAAVDVAQLLFPDESFA